MLDGDENPFADPQQSNNRRGGRAAAPTPNTTNVVAAAAGSAAGTTRPEPSVDTANNNNNATTKPSVAAFGRFINNNNHMTTSSSATSTAASTPTTPHQTFVPSSSNILAERFKNVKLEQISKIEASQEATVNKAILLPSNTREDGIVCCGEDRTVRVYLRRESGIFWPSVCTYASCPIATLTFDAETRRIFCGLANGNIHEYVLAPDFNSLHLKKQIVGTHSKRIVELAFSLQCEWIVSIAKDRLLAWHCSESGERVGCVTLADQATCFCFDQATKHVFVGDESGAVVMLRLGERGEQQLVTKFSGHTAGITALHWNPVAEMLFSGGADKLVVAWDIGSKQGIAYELNAHTGRLVGLNYAGEL